MAETSCLNFTFQMDSVNTDESLDLENTLWTNCVIASGQATGVVIYTGKTLGNFSKFGVENTKGFGF